MKDIWHLADPGRSIPRCVAETSWQCRLEVLNSERCRLEQNQRDQLCYRSTGVGVWGNFMANIWTGTGEPEA